MLARAYFLNAGPFENAINSIISDWTDFKTIRNAAAHLSSNTADKLDGLASRRLGTPTAGITVERFVLSTQIPEQHRIPSSIHFKQSSLALLCSSRPDHCY